MQKQVKMLVVGITCLILAFCFTLNAEAQTPPVLQISDGTTTLTVDGAAHVTCTGAGPCTTASVSAVPGSGLISWAGKLGVFTSPFSVAGKTKPTLMSPQVDIAVNGLRTAVGQNATLTVQWTDTGFSGTPPFHFHEGTNVAKNNSAQALGTSTATFAAYVDDGNGGNNLFGQAKTVYTYSASPLSSGPSTQDVTGLNTSVNAPFSMTNVVTINLGSNTVFTTDFYDYGSPAPPIAVQCFSQTTGVVGTPFSSALMASGGTGLGYTYAISSGSLPPDLTLDTATGIISGTPSDADVGMFNVFFQVTDSGGNTAVTSGSGCPLTITTPPAPMLTCPPTSGVVGTPYSGSLNATGGLPPYNFSITSGSLPPGINLDSLQQTNNLTGIEPVTGTPTSPGVFNFTAQVVDARGDTNGTTTSQCLVNVTEQPQLSVVKTPKGGIFTMGAQVSYQIVVSNPAPAGSSDATNVVLTDTLPTNGGLTWTSAVASQGSCSIASGAQLTCALGSIPAQGSAIVTVTSPSTTPNEACTSQPNPLAQATADGGLIASDNGSLVCTPPPITANCVAITAVQGVAIPNTQLVASGGTGTGYVFSNATGLPPGVTISPSGVLSGTPTTSGTFNYSVTITDSAGNTGTLNCSVTVNPPLSFSCGVINNAVQGVAITPITLSASGGTGGYTFSSSDLGTYGLAISAGGTITGVPNTSGTIAYHVTVTDSAGNTSTNTCSLYVNPPLSFACGVINNAVQGVAITPITLSASGGTGGYTFSSSDLGTYGLSISSGGTITGIPNTSGTITYHVTVKDSAGNTSTDTCSLYVNPPAPPPLMVSCPTQGTATVGTLYTSQVPVTGGTPPYTYVLNTGSLPPGLMLNPDGSITGTPTSAGSFTFSIKVTDSLGMTAISQCSSSCTAITDDYTFLQYLGTLGTSQAYTVNGLTITAYGYYWDGSNPTNPGTPTNLYGKQAGGDENGLGIANTSSDHEITNKTFVQLDLQNVVNAGATGAQMSVGSVQPGESYAIYGSAKQGVLGTLLTPTPLTADDTVFAVPGFGQYRYISVTAVTNDVLLEVFSVSFPQGCTIVVSPAPLVVSCPANTGKVGIPYNSSVVVSGGTAPYTFQITSGSLPPGLTLNSMTGAITGTPTAGGTYTFTTTVTDSTGGSALTVAKKCTITISAPPTPPVVSCPPNKGGTVGTYFTTTIPVTGGTAPFTFSISSGSLPPGLKLNSTTGVISGTPTTAGSYSFTIMVVDGAGNVVYSSCGTGCTNISEKFDFLAACGKFYSSKVYKTNGIALTAYGYDNWGRQRNLNGRGYGNADDGLGISGNLDDGIDSNSYVQFDLTNAIAAGASDVQISVGSIHSGETYNVYGSNTLGQPGTLLLANCKADGGTIHVPSFPNHKYICIRANYRCVHVKNITCNNPCKCSITISKKGCTYSKGEWGTSGNDGWNKAHDGWGTVYGSKGSCVRIGGSKGYTFTNADNVGNFLNKSGYAGPASYSSTNPTSGNDFATQVLALQMNVDFSNAGVLAPGLANLKIQSGILKGWTVQQVLDVSNQLLGGDIQLPYWMQWSDATSILSSINTALDNGSYDSGYLDIN